MYSLFKSAHARHRLLLAGTPNVLKHTVQFAASTLLPQFVHLTSDILFLSIFIDLVRKYNLMNLVYNPITMIPPHHYIISHL